MSDLRARADFSSDERALAIRTRLALAAVSGDDADLLEHAPADLTWLLKQSNELDDEVRAAFAIGAVHTLRLHAGLAQSMRQVEELKAALAAAHETNRELEAAIVELRINPAEGTS